MTDPKIRYDVQAQTTGQAEVNRLADSLERLDDAIDPVAAQRARELSVEIRQLGQRGELIETFTQIKQSVALASAELEEAQAAAQKLGKELSEVEKPTRAQAGQLEKLRDAVRAAKIEVQEQTLALDAARQRLTQAGVSSVGLAAEQVKVRQALQGANQEAAELVAGYTALKTAQQAAVGSAQALAAAEAQALQATARAAEESRAATQRLVSEARSAGQAMNAAFGQTGVRSLQAIEAEISDVERAVSLLQRRFGAGAISADDLARAVAGAAVRLNTLKTEMATMPAVPGAFSRLADQVNGLISRFGALSAAVATVGVAVKPILDATVALESMRRILTTVTGSAEAAQQEIDFLRVVAQRSGQAFDQVGEGYAKFAASAAQSNLSMEQIRDVFGAVALAAGNLGLSTEKTENALTALGQIASKGVVSMEELRQQLGDAIPGVLPALAKELGLTQAELQKVVSSGRLLATEALPAIGRALAGLQPQGGTVDGLTASWNRFINVVKEAGTVVVEGPLGQGVGVVLAAVGGVLRDLTVVATGASEAFKLFGLTVLSTFDALRGDITFEQLKQRVSDFAVESGARLEKFQVTAYGAADASKQLGATAQSLGTSFARLALDQQRAIEGAERQVQATGQLVEAMKAEAQAAATLADLIGDEPAKRQAAAQAADATAAAAARHAAAEDALVKVLTASREATVAKAQADGQGAEAIKATVEALDAQIQKADASAEKARAQANAARAQALAMQLSSEAAGDNSRRLEELRAKVEAAEIAFKSKQRALRLDATTSDEVRIAAEQLAKAKGLLRDAIDDVSEALERNLKLLRADAELARQGLQLELEQAKNAARRAEEQGNETAARQANIRARELELRIATLGIDLKRQEAEAGLRELSVVEQNLRALGLLTAEKQLEIETRRKAYLASVLEAAAQNEANASKREEVTNLRAGKVARDELTASTSTSTGATERDSKALKENTTARAENTNSILKQDAALEKLRNGPVLGGIGPSQDGVNFGVRSAGGEANRVNGLTPIDSFGNLIRSTPSGGITRTGSAQFQPPDNSGEWVFDAEAYNRAASSPGSRLSSVDPRNFWRRSLTAGVSAEGFGGASFGFGGAPFGFNNARAPAPAPAPLAGGQFVTASGGRGVNLPSGGVQVVFNFGLRSYTVQANSVSEAEALMRDLEAHYQNNGGGG